MLRRICEAEELHRQVACAIRCDDVPSLHVLQARLEPGNTARTMLTNPVPEKLPQLPPEEMALPPRERENAMQRRYQARFFQLSATLQLLSCCTDVDIPEARKILCAMVRDMCEGDLLSNLVNSAKLLFQDLKSPPLFEGHDAWVQSERRLLALCLFYASTCVQVAVEEIKTMVDLLKHVQLQLVEIDSGLQEQSYGTIVVSSEFTRNRERVHQLRNHVNEFCYLLYMALGNALLPRVDGLIVRTDLDSNGRKVGASAPSGSGLQGPAVKEGPNCLMGNKDLMEWIKSQCAESACWTSPHTAPRPTPTQPEQAEPVQRLPYQTMLLLPMAMALDYHQSKEDAENRDDKIFFDGLEAFPLIKTHIFGSPTFWPDIYHRDYQRSWNAFLTHLVHHASDVIAGLASEELVLLQNHINESALCYQRSPMPPPLLPSLFASLLQLIGICHKDMGFCSDWLETGQERYRPWLLFREAPDHIKKLENIKAQMFSQFYQIECSGGQPPPVDEYLHYIEAFEIAYLDMLSNIVDTSQAALAIHGALSSDSQASGLKWEEYFDHLRSEVSPMGIDSGYGYSHVDMEQERPIREDYCTAIWRLVAQVVRHSSAVLAQFVRPGDRAEPVDLLIRFLCCAGVHQALAGQVFQTLGALADPRHDAQPSDARSHSARLAWLQLDQLEVLVTDPQDPNPNRGMHFDFARECDVRRFPETIGFLQWLEAVMMHLMGRLPSTERWPSFGPHLWFVTHTIFSNCLNRQYDRDDERWELASCCLRIIKGVLQHYEPDAAHFRDGVQAFDIRKRYCSDEEPQVPLNIFQARLAGSAFPTTTPSSGVEISNITWCGYWLMRELLQATDLLTRILEIIPKVSVLNPSAGSHQEQCAQLALKVLELLLAKQTAFHSLHTAAASKTNGAGFLKQLESHLLHMSYYPEPGTSSLLLEITNFLRLQGSVLQSSAMKVLKRLAASQFDITGVYFRRADRAHALQLFVKALREERFQRPGDQAPDAPESEKSESIGAAIADLVILALQNPLRKTPNMAHFLCGFDLDNPRVLARTVIEQQRQQQQQQQPLLGPVPQADVPESCLDVILDELLHTDIITQQPHLAELYYEVVYQLASNPDMSDAIFSHLSSLDFFAIQRKVLHKHRYILASSSNFQLLASAYNQRCYILKTIALFLHLETLRQGPISEPNTITPAQRQTAAVRDVVNWCWDRSAPEAMPLRSIAAQCYTDDMQWEGGPLQPAEQPIAFVLEFLQDVDFAALMEKNPIPDLVSAATSPVFRHLSAATHRNTKGVEEYNIRLLHQQLEMTLKMTYAGQSVDSGMHNPDLALQQQEEIRRILNAALKANERFALYHAVCSAVEGWAQVVEVTMFKSADPQARDLLSLYWAEDTEQVVGRVLQCIMAKLAQMFMPVRNTSLLNSLRCLRPIQSILSRTASCLMTRLRMRQGANAFHLGPTETATRSMTAHQNLLSALIPCIVESTSAQFRANGYAVLANYLEYTEGDITNKVQMDRPSKDLTLPELHRQQALHAHRQVMQHHGPQLIRVIAADTLEGTNFGIQAVAWAALDALVRFDAARGAMVQMMDKNTMTLQQTMHALQQLDKALCETLDIHCGDIHATHVFESMMSFLISVSLSSGGAQLLQEKYHVMGIVSQMQFLHRISAVLPSDGVAYQDPHSTLPSVRTRCSMLLLPVLQLITALFQRLHCNVAVADQVAGFVGGHSKVLKHVLRRPHNHCSGNMDGIDTAALREISAVTGLLNLLATHRHVLATKVGPDPVRKFGLLSVLGRFCRKEYWHNFILADLEDEDPKGSEYEQLLLVRRIVRNIMEICSKCSGALTGVKSIDDKGLSSQMPVFELSIAKFSARLDYTSARPSQEDLSLVLHVIKGCVDGLQDAHRTLSELEQKLKSSHNAPPPQQWKPTGTAMQPAPVDQHALLKQYLQTQTTQETLSCTLENALLLLHFHLRLAYTSDQPFSTPTLPYSDQLALITQFHARDTARAMSTKNSLQELKKATRAIDVIQLFDAVRDVTKPEANAAQKDHERKDFAYRLCELIQAATD